MKLYIQWSTDPPADWIEFDSREWIRLPHKPKPCDPDIIDGGPGWCAAILCLGHIIQGHDHYHVSHTSDGFPCVTVWNDDTEDFPRIYGVEYIFPGPHPPLITFYEKSNGHRRPHRDWSLFSFPPSNETIHGIWLSDKAWASHEQVRRANPYAGG